MLSSNREVLEDWCKKGLSQQLKKGLENLNTDDSAPIKLDLGIIAIHNKQQDCLNKMLAQSRFFRGGLSEQSGEA